MAEQTTLHLHPAHRGPISAAFFQRINLEPNEDCPLFGEALDVMFEYLNHSDYIIQQAKEYYEYNDMTQEEIVSKVLMAVCDFYNERGWERINVEDLFHCRWEHIDICLPLEWKALIDHSIVAAIT